MGENTKRKRGALIGKSNFKINLGLYVTEKRPDGFHNLETIFYPVENLYDIISIESAENTSFEMIGGDFVTVPEKNLCVKAFRLLQEKYNLSGAHIRLEKNIPSGAGLGGGSANAATVLKMTDSIFNLHISNSLLKEYAASLGSDVAFFIDNTPAYATGKGEILTPISINLTDKVISVFKPEVSIPTAEAYAHITPLPGRPCLKNLINEPIEKWKFLIVNDFEKSVFQKHPILAEIKKKYYELGASYAALSGSGSALFAIADFPIKLGSYFSGIDL